MTSRHAFICQAIAPTVLRQENRREQIPSDFLPRLLCSTLCTTIPAHTIQYGKVQYPGSSVYQYGVCLYSYHNLQYTYSYNGFEHLPPHRRYDPLFLNLDFVVPTAVEAECKRRVQGGLSDRAMTEHLLSKPLMY